MRPCLGMCSHVNLQQLIIISCQGGQKELHCVFVDIEKVCDAEIGIVVLYEEVRSSRKRM